MYGRWETAKFKDTAVWIAWVVQWDRVEIDNELPVVSEGKKVMDETVVTVDYCMV